MKLPVAIGCVLLAIGCQQSAVQLDPKIARLVGTWTLAKPDSSAGTTVTFMLDTANPPHDITSFTIQGQGLRTAYTGRMYATIDGTMQFQQITQSGETDNRLAQQQIDHLYLTNLQSVARYEQPTDSTLRLYFGSPHSGVLSYKLSR